MKGIDVSHWNSDVDFEQAKKQGIEFVIIKAGGSDSGLYADSKFKLNYQNAKQAGLKVGSYYYLGKDFVEADYSGMRETKHYYSIIKDYKFDFPCFIDIEEKFTLVAGDITVGVNWMAEYLKDKGYIPGYYGSDVACFGPGGLVFRKGLSHWPIWVARYGSEPREVSDWSIWQKDNKYKIGNSSIDFDLNESKYDFKGQWPPPNVSHETDENEIFKIAKEVIAGKYGIGAERKLKLEQAGYDYHKVQAMVNQILYQKG